MTRWQDRLYRKLSVISSLSAEDFACTNDLVCAQKSYSRNELLKPCPATMAVVAEGWFYRYRLLEDGRRMVFNFWLPGDLINLAPITPGPVSQTAAVDAAELVHIAGADFTSLCDTSPALADAFAANERLDALLLANQVLRLGRLTAHERVAHLFLELWDRLNLVGLADGGRFPLPFTYSMLADVAGLSNVHVSRTMTRLRENGLIEADRRTIFLKAPRRLAELTEYDPIGGVIDPEEK